MSSNLPHVPYFYIIEHTPSGKRYSGSKWAKGCHPDTFMVEGGYTTSSNIVNDLIKKDGIDSFNILLIETNFGFGMSAYEYETVFLQTHNIANDYNWLNQHNNDGFDTSTFGTEKFKSLMLDRYGVENCMQSKVIQNRVKETMLKRYGVECSLQNDTIKAKRDATWLEKYGGNPATDIDVIQSIKDTNLVRYGTECSLKNIDVAVKRDATWLEKYGGNPLSNAAIRMKIENTNLEKYGVTHHTKTEEEKQNIKTRMTGLISWNDGENEFKRHKDIPPETHWVRGGLPRKKYVYKSST